MELQPWIADGGPDRWRTRGRIVDFIGLAFIITLYFALAFINAAFRLKLENEIPGESFRNYSRHGAVPFDETREPLIRAW